MVDYMGYIDHLLHPFNILTVLSAYIKVFVLWLLLYLDSLIYLLCIMVSTAIVPDLLDIPC